MSASSPAASRRFTAMRRISSFVRLVFCQAIDETERVRLGRGYETAREQEILGPARTERVDQPAVRRARETVPQRPRDWDAEGRCWSRDAEVADQRDRAAAAGCHTLDLRDRGFGDALEPIQHVVEALLVFDAVLAIAKAAKLRDVGARDERFAAGAAQDEDANRLVGVDALARRDERFVHLPRHRVARLGPVEG
jgi:hypothetical protein